ncbi:hypothetical protein H0H81_000397 [Sphagnurus paluster]|uniref:Oxidoreductase AflY n=1 Tax=Sphagnurus paluster TaxID=117069 RepID=A0A9P7FN30_9AGAR|nr:hypothetical protein H0H81_000397 [Sphagnurus paluster]
MDLFPIPSFPPSAILPRPWPGINPESTAALREVLNDNHKRWFIFFNDRNLHNHCAHHAIANWAFGGSADIIKAGYQKDSAIQRAAFDSPKDINLENFKDHIGDRNYYGGYLTFFTNAVREHGIAATIERYVFTEDMNIDPSADHNPYVFNRLLGGVFHPMIHVGYGLEFGLPGMVIEGLAQTVVHADNATAAIPDGFFNYANVKSLEDNTLSRLESLVVSEESSTKKSDGVHAFTVLQRILDDPELGKAKDIENPLAAFQDIMKVHRDTLTKHMSDWYVDVTKPFEVERKIEELSWVNVLIYAVGGWAESKEFNADFLHMHMVTSSIFLAAYAAYLKPSSQEQLLRAYFLVSLGWWVSRGRAALDIDGFYAGTSAHPQPSGPLPTPHEKALGGIVTPNAWLPIIESSIVHPDDHVSKIQRTFAHYNTLYGTRESGRQDFSTTQLRGAEKLDGSLFIRAAGLTAQQIGRVREGEPPVFWSFDGFFESNT